MKTNGLTRLLLPALAVLITYLSTASAWWDYGWERRRPFVLNNTGFATSTDTVTILIRFTPADSVYPYTQAHGEDIRFVDEDDLTMLDHEIELWDTAGTSFVWVQVPDIADSTQADSIFFYYRNTFCADGQDTTGTWDGGYMSVWHMNEDTAMGIRDRTANGYDEAVNGGTRQVKGLIGYAREFNYVNDSTGTYIRMEPFDIVSADSGLTIETWVLAYEYEVTQPHLSQNRIIEKSDPGSNRGDGSARYWMVSTHRDSIVSDPDEYTANNVRSRFRLKTTDDLSSTNTLIDNGTSQPYQNMPESTWYYVVGWYDAGTKTQALFVNGVQVATETDAGWGDIAASPTTPVFIGAGCGWPTYDDIYNPWDGIIDEVRISNMTRSPSWIKTQYLLKNNSGYAAGVVEQGPPTIAAAEYHSAGTDGVNGDSLIVTLSFGILDATMPSTPDSMFDVLGLGSMNNASLTTGSAANDNIVVVKFSGTDTIFCHNRTRLALYDSVVSGPGGKPCRAGTVDVVTKNVGVPGTGDIYETVTEAYAAAAAGDSILVFDAGLYPETLTVTNAMTFIGYGIGNDYDSLPVFLDPQTLTDGWHALLTCNASVSVSGFKFVCLTDSVKPMDFLDYSNSQAHVIRNCVFDGAGIARNCFLDDFWRGKTTIDSCEFSGFTVQCIWFRHDDWAFNTGKNITNCYFHDINGPAVWIQDSREADITGNTFRNVNNNYGIVRITASFDIEISGNVFDSCSGASSSYGSVNMDNNAYYYWIKNNIFSNCTTLGGAIVFSGNHFGHTTNNLIYDCTHGIKTTGSNNYLNTIIFNTIVSCDSGGITISTRSTDTDTVKYNIAWGNGNYDFRNTATMPIAESNFHGIGGLDNWTTGIFTDSGYPRFVDTTAAGGYDWHLTASSPCIDFSFVDSTLAAAISAGTDLDGLMRPMPAGTWADAGCYEEQTAGRMDVVNTDYRSVGTGTAADDTMTVWFRHNVDYDSLPLGPGDADLFFGVQGGGSIANATIVTPSGLNDTDFVYVHLNAGDSVLSHNRTDLVTQSAKIYSAAGFPSLPDTDHVRTWNVRNMTDGVEYRTIFDALNDSVMSDGDTVMIFDNGYYTDTLKVNRPCLVTNSGGNWPQIRYGGALIDGDWEGDLLVRVTGAAQLNGLIITGVNSAETDTAGDIYMSNGSLDACSLKYVETYFNSGLDSICDTRFFHSRIYYRGSGAHFLRNTIDSYPGTGISFYNGQNALVMHNIITNCNNGLGQRNARNTTYRNNIFMNCSGFSVTQSTAYSSEISYHNTFSNNVFYNNGNGVRLDSASTFENNICFNNGTFELRVAGTAIAYTDSIRYNLFDSTGSGLGAVLAHPGNVITTDAPRFADPSSIDLHLAVHSPAIDRGDTAAAYADYDGSRCDMGAYGGPYAIDTLNPHRLDTLAAFSTPLQGYASDTVWWEPYTLADFSFYAVYRGLDGDFAPSEANCIDSIYDITTLGARYTNDGGAYVYKISAVDTANYGGGYRGATYARVFTAKATHQIHTIPGDTLTYAVYYDNDGELPTSDTVTFVDYLPGNVTFIDTTGIVPHNGGSVDVDWYTGTWHETEPAVLESVTALRWQVPATIAAHDDGGDTTGADAGKTGIDTTGGDDAGAVYFKVLVK